MPPPTIVVPPIQLPGGNGDARVPRPNRFDGTSDMLAAGPVTTPHEVEPPYSVTHEAEVRHDAAGASAPSFRPRRKSTTRLIPPTPLPSPGEATFLPLPPLPPQAPASSPASRGSSAHSSPPAKPAPQVHPYAHPYMPHSLPALQDGTGTSRAAPLLPLMQPKRIAGERSLLGWCGGLVGAFTLLTLIQTVICASIIWLVGHRALQATVGELTEQLRLAILDDSIQRVNAEFATIMRVTHQLRFMTVTRFPDFATRLRIDDRPGYLSDMTKLTALYPQIDRLGIVNAHALAAFIATPPSLTTRSILSDSGQQTVYMEQPFYSEGELKLYTSQPIHPANQYAPPFSIQGEIRDDDSPADIARYLGPVRLTLPWVATKGGSVWRGALDLPVGQLAGWIAPLRLLPTPNVPAQLGLTAVSLSYGQVNVTGDEQNSTSSNGIEYLAFVSLSAAAFSKFLTQLPFGPNGKGYLIRYPTGGCVASSVPALADFVRTNAAEIDLASSNDPFLAILYPILIEQGFIMPPSARVVNRTTSFAVSPDFMTPNGAVFQHKFHVQGDDWRMQAQMADQALSGAPYFIVVVTREADFNGHLRSNVTTTIWTTVIVVVIAIVFSSFVAACVKAPLLRIVKFLERANNVVAMPRDDEQRAALATLCRDWSRVLRNDTTAQCSFKALTGADSNEAASRDSVPDDIASPLVELSQAQLPSGKCQPGSCLNAGRWLREIDLMYRSFGAMLFSLASYDELESINQAKRQFIRYIFHEVRVPFNAIVLGIEQMEMDLALHSRLDSDCEAALAPCTETMAIVHEQGEVVSRILNDVLSMQKIEDGALTLDFSAFDLEKMVRVALHAFRVPCREKRLHLHLRCPNLDQLITSHRARIPLLQAYPNVHLGTIPSPEAHDLAGAWRAHIEADPYRLRQALANFVSNAIKFSNKGGTITVVLEFNDFTPVPVGFISTRPNPPQAASPLPNSGERASSNAGTPRAHDLDASRALLASPEQGDLQSPAEPAPKDLEANGKCLGTVDLVIRVRDTGVGLAPAACARLFQQYAQVAANRHQAGGGTGLGLSITKSIIQLHGGTIGVTSREGEGSEFVISIPRVRVILTHTDEPSLSSSGAVRHDTSAIVDQTSLVSHTLNWPERNALASQPSSTRATTRRLRQTASESLRCASPPPTAARAESMPLPTLSFVPSKHPPVTASSAPATVRTLDSAGSGQAQSARGPLRSPVDEHQLSPPGSHLTVSTGGASPATFPTTSPLHEPGSAAVLHVRFHASPSPGPASPPTAEVEAAEGIGELPVIAEHATQRQTRRSSNSRSTLGSRSSSNSGRSGGLADEPSMFVDSPHFAHFASTSTSPATRRSSLSDMPTLSTTFTSPPDKNRRASISLTYETVLQSTSQPTLQAPLSRTEDMSVLAGVANTVPTSAPSSVHRPSRLSGPSSRAARPQKSSGIRLGARVLVVEDSLPNRKLLLSILTHLGLLAVGVENGKECVDRFPDEPTTVTDPPFDAVIMDGNMPVMNGVEATRILRSRGVTIPVIAVTGNALAEDVANFIGAGATSVLTKPINRTQLAQALAAQLPPLVIEPSTKTPVPAHSPEQ